MIMNRIADVFFIIGILLVFLFFKTTDFITVMNLLPILVNEEINSYFFFYKNFNFIELITLFLFIGSIGKSAQIIFHT